MPLQLNTHVTGGWMIHSQYQKIDSIKESPSGYGMFGVFPQPGLKADSGQLSVRHRQPYVWAFFPTSAEGVWPSHSNVESTYKPLFVWCYGLSIASFTAWANERTIYRWTTTGEKLVMKVASSIIHGGAYHVLTCARFPQAVFLIVNDLSRWLRLSSFGLCRVPSMPSLRNSRHDRIMCHFSRSVISSLHSVAEPVE